MVCRSSDDASYVSRSDPFCPIQASAVFPDPVTYVPARDSQIRPHKLLLTFTLIKTIRTKQSDLLTSVVPQFRLLYSGFSWRRPAFEPRSEHVGFWWTKRHCGRFSPDTSVSLANHSTDYTTLVIIRHPGLVQ
jgi:hypothetical protein